MLMGFWVLCETLFPMERHCILKEVVNCVHKHTSGLEKPSLEGCYEETYRSVCQDFYFVLQQGHLSKENRLLFWGSA